MKLRTRARLSPAADQVPKVALAARRTANNFASADDPLGSYTGTPADGGKPVQDADDL